MLGVDDRVDWPGIARFRPQSPRWCDDAGVVMAWCVGYDWVAVSDARYVPVEEGVSRAEGGSGRGSENRREDCSSRAVGELYAFDMTAVVCSRRCFKTVALDGLGRVLI